MTMQNPASMTPLIPENAPFSLEQRAWLNGFFAGLLALDNQSITALPPEQAASLPGVSGSPPAKAKGPLDDGDDGEASWHDPAMAMAERMTLAEGRPLRRRLMAAMAQQDCGQCGYNCEDYANNIFLQAEERLNLCVPGGKETARMLKKLVEDMGGGVIDPDEKAAKAAAKAAAKPAEADSGPGRSRDNPVEATFVSKHRLNKDRSEKVTNHIVFDLAESGLDYKVGDSFGVFPANDPDLVKAILWAIGAPGSFPVMDRTLRHVLTHETALSPAPDMLFELISYLSGGERRKKARALAKGEDPDGDAANLDVLAALEKFRGIRPDPEAFIEALEPLQPRLYSISSSPKAEPGRVSLTVDAVRYKLNGRTRLGVASTFLDERVTSGGKAKVYVQRTHGFGLPADDSLPVIMVGPGTGIAPFRAFLQERLASKAPGRAWLFFGHQRRACDFFYEDELAGLQATGVLTKLSLAWSRDGQAKVYVQDRMREEGAGLYAWLEAGAHFYVCGDAKRMAKDVDAALHEIIAAHGGKSLEEAAAYIAALKKAGRYQADVY